MYGYKNSMRVHFLSKEITRINWLVFIQILIIHFKMNVASFDLQLDSHEMSPETLSCRIILTV